MMPDTKFKRRFYDQLSTDDYNQGKFYWQDRQPESLNNLIDAADGLQLENPIQFDTWQMKDTLRSWITTISAGDGHLTAIARLAGNRSVYELSGWLRRRPDSVSHRTYFDRQSVEEYHPDMFTGDKDGRIPVGRILSWIEPNLKPAELCEGSHAEDLFQMLELPLPVLRGAVPVGTDREIAILLNVDALVCLCGCPVS